MKIYSQRYSIYSTVSRMPCHFTLSVKDTPVSKNRQAQNCGYYIYIYIYIFSKKQVRPLESNRLLNLSEQMCVLESKERNIHLQINHSMPSGPRICAMHQCLKTENSKCGRASFGCPPLVSSFPSQDLERTSLF